MANLTIQHAKSDTIADWTGTVTVGNTSGGTATAAATDLVRPSDWNSAHNYSISIYDTDLPDIEFYEVFPLANTASTASSGSNGTWYLQPFVLPRWIESGYFMVPEVGGASTACFVNSKSFLGSTNTGNCSYGMTVYDRLALYSPGDGANASKLNSLWSGNCDIFATMSVSVTATTTNLSTFSVNAYATVSVPYQWDNSGNASYSTFTGSSQFTTTGSSMVSSAISGGFTVPSNYVSGSRVAFFPLATTLAGGEYVMAHMISTVTANGTTGGANLTSGGILPVQSVVGMADVNFNPFKQIGKSTTNANSAMMPFQGFWTGSSSLPPSTIGSNEISYTANRFYFAKDERSRG